MCCPKARPESTQLSALLHGAYGACTSVLDAVGSSPFLLEFFLLVLALSAILVLINNIISGQTLDPAANKTCCWSIHAIKPSSSLRCILPPVCTYCSTSSASWWFAFAPSTRVSSYTNTIRRNPRSETIKTSLPLQTKEIKKISTLQ